MKSLPLTACLALAAAPVQAMACGGLFCNSAAPIVQAGEQILFAQDDDGTIHMHVQLNYAGPPQDFGWILPTPRGVETGLSTEGLFSSLSQFAPSYSINSVERLVDCAESDAGAVQNAGPFSDSGVAESGGAGGEPPPGVLVVSREVVGPFDRVILSAESVEDLRIWLDENGYQIPAESDERLRPYVEGGSVFVAIKLVADAGTNDIVPLRLSFPGELPSIPIVPTSVAATPDMGITVYVLGSARAIPANYLHVQVNEAAIDWSNSGSNYFDVVAQAADEAMGRAFATDFAGRHEARSDTSNFKPISATFKPISAGSIDALRPTRTVGELAQAICDGGLPMRDIDVQRLLTDVISSPPQDGTANCETCLGCIGNASDEVINGEELATRLTVEVNEPRESLKTLFDRHAYLTRLFTTMSPEDMTADPAFIFGRDLPEVGSVHLATQLIDRCAADGTYDTRNFTIRTPSGLMLGVVDGEQADVIRREGGQTVRQGEEPGAAVIEQLLSSGQGRVEVDNVPDIVRRHERSADETTGCDCSTSGGKTTSSLLIGLLFVMSRLRRGRRQGR